VKIIQTIGWIAPRYGGPAIFVPHLARALALRGHEVVLITTNADGAGVIAADQIPSAEEAGYTTLACERDWPRSYLTSRAMTAALDAHLRSADVVHIHCLYRFHTLASRRLCDRLGVPYVLSPHGALGDYQRGRHRLRKLLYHRLVEDRNIKHASVLQYTSEVEKAEVESCGFGVPGVVVASGLDVAELRLPTDKSLLPTAVRDGDGPFVAFVGRLAAKKGIPRLISALAIIRESVPDARLVIAGPDDNGLETDFRALARRLGIADGVIFVGPVYGREKVALYQHARVFGLPSDDENFGMVVAEAMAAGTPVVISDRVALHGLVAERSAGSVVGTDPAEVAGGLLPYLQDPRLARERGLNAAAAASEQFSWETVAARFEELYAGVAERSRVRL
jgi:glycosyltransferase involved in cell wall biosynthesis